MPNIPLPERLEDLLPAEAETVDRAARAVLEMLAGFGYRLVMPPLAEALPSLLAESASDSELASRTLQLTDPLGGAPIGIRADITPQLRRIDAQIGSKAIERLCYCGPTLYARPINPWQSREQLQAGAELFGAQTKPGNAEILMLAIRAMHACGLAELAVALGHAGIINALLADLSPEKAAATRRSITRRDPLAMREHSQQLLACARIASVADLEQLNTADLPAGAADGFAELNDVAALLAEAGVETIIDLPGLAGHEYHNGVTFAVLSGEKIVARGGRYDRAGRSAIGFTADIRQLASELAEARRPEAVASPAAWHDPAWRAAVDKLAEQGKQLCLDDETRTQSCRQRLVHSESGWQVVTGEQSQ
ncbi:MAG: ATP phosphoribosyltransferase regulatory subunit [Betaproteobacteria bacterium]|nr:ATP phosphoribosyltransferase regulatory subunit [Betaproteobacteria bacterium]